jgi:hypothetical protein
MAFKHRSDKNLCTRRLELLVHLQAAFFRRRVIFCEVAAIEWCETNKQGVVVSSF